MLNKILEEIIGSIVGRPAEGIVSLLNKPNYVNEFILAKKLGMTINQTRNILYKISDYGLVASVRKKDKKKGWYTYFWKFEIIKCLEFLKDNLLKSRLSIEEEIEKRISKVFYVCEYCGLEYDEDQALLMNFTCDECGRIFTAKDNSKIIRELEKSLSKIDDKLKEVDLEMQKEQDKIGRKRAILLKKEEKEKAKRKEEMKLKRRKSFLKKKREKEKVKKSSGKKVSKKKKAKNRKQKKSVKTNPKKKKKVVKAKPRSKKKTIKAKPKKAKKKVVKTKTSTKQRKKSSKKKPKRKVVKVKTKSKQKRKISKKAKTRQKKKRK